MSATIDAIREILTLTENVRGLTDDVVRLAAEVKDLRERLVRLESREELVIEKTRNAAIVAVTQMNGSLLERMINLETSHANGIASPNQATALLPEKPANSRSTRTS